MKKLMPLLMMPLLLLNGCGADTFSNTEASEKETKLQYPAAPPELKLCNTSAIFDSDRWGTMNGHDPAIFKDEASGKYYIYSTDVQSGTTPKAGVQIRYSEDLITWKFLGWAFEEGIPEEVRTYTDASNLWAPDIIKVGNEYRLYTSASTFGSQRSCIFLAVSDKPEGPFKYKGIVLKTNAGDPVNAIDANIVVEEGTGQQYMAYGSFWSGINILKLDNDTGMLAEQVFGKNIAQRPRTVDGAVEGSYISYNKETGWYYLFVSYGSLASDYNIRVGRSKSVSGPYIDYNGIEMTDLGQNPYKVGLKIAGGYQFIGSKGWMAPGHNSVMNDNGDWYLVHHARPNGEVNWPYIQVRRLYWSDDGWPLASPMPYAGEKLQKIGTEDIQGTYERIKHIEVAFQNAEKPEKMTLNPDNTCMVGKSIGKWQLEGDQKLVVVFGETTESYIVIPGWDWDVHKEALILTGMNNNSECVWGRKIQ